MKTTAMQSKNVPDSIDTKRKNQIGPVLIGLSCPVAVLYNICELIMI